jgi:hypothetical protein
MADAEPVVSAGRARRCPQASLAYRGPRVAESDCLQTLDFALKGC